MVVYPRKSGRVWVEPAARRVLAGRGGMGRPPRRFPRANGLSVPRVPTTERLPRRSLARWTNEQPLHLERGMTHDALKRYLESAPSLAELASALIPGVDSDSLINLHAGCAQPDSAILAQSFWLTNKQEKTAPRINGRRGSTCRTSETSRRRRRTSWRKWPPPRPPPALPRPRPCSELECIGGQSVFVCTRTLSYNIFGRD